MLNVIGSPNAALEAGLTEIDLFEATEYYRSPRGCAPNGETEARVLTADESKS